VTKGEGIEIRKCAGLQEFRRCVEIQKEVWSFSDAELVPLRLFVVADKVGGQVVGAFDGGAMVGFTLAVPGLRHGHPYFHSHMAGVLDGYRDAGIGRRMKLFQRDDAIARGIDLVEWTFDPLEIKNSFFNVERLGAIARRYTINQYGQTSSALHGGLPTDRLIAEWWLRSRRVQELLQGGTRRPFAAKREIAVPAEISQWKANPETRDQAAAVQQRNQAAFLQAFGQGLAVLGYARDATGNGTFQLGPWDETWGTHPAMISCRLQRRPGAE
jgi:predicted GNAT superfamily acetyltransferase